MSEWLGHFKEYGYALVPAALPHDLIDAHVAAVAGVFETHGAHHNTRLIEWNKARIEAMMRDMEKLDVADSPSLRLAMHASVRGRMRELFEDEPVRSSVRTAFWEFGDRAPHFDTTFLSTTPEHAVCRAWCALDDIHPGSGVFYVVPGTHRTARAQVLEGAMRDHPEYEELLDRLFEDREGVQPELHRRVWPDLCQRMAQAIEGIQRVTFPIRKGDVVFFSPNAIHGTMPRSNDALPRKVMITEWRARSARLYFASEHFGSRYDRRSRLGAGRSADYQIQSTPQGLIGVPYP